MKSFIIGLLATGAFVMPAAAEMIYQDPYSGTYGPRTYNGGTYIEMSPDRGGGTSIIYDTNGDTYTCYSYIYECYPN